ncbi:MAG: ParB/RepB/Spo0J family partition protein [Oligoflexia bacterium]|nr:ParB/RepB/Spo0J family partition protein [Oligoflexia bacterium]
MSKTFLPRKTKKERATLSNIQSSSSLQNLIRYNDQKLLKGAELSEVKLSEITVREQVRTKFNEGSLKELAENIKVNGLIQPLVIHREGSKFVLLCGERRFRAMKLINKERAPCFILEGKSKEELLAIQFSENSSREELHYIDKADGIYNYQVATGSSERKIETDLGISKSEVHRSILLAKLPTKLKEAAKIHDIEKYVLIEFDELEENYPQRQSLEKSILEGGITKRAHLKKFLSLHKALKEAAQSISVTAAPISIPAHTPASISAIVKKSKSKSNSNSNSKRLTI